MLKKRVRPTETHSAFLLQDVNRKNTSFLVALALLSALSFIFVVVLLILSLNVQNKTTKTLETQQTIIDQLNTDSKQRTGQINDLQNHINCIVTLFTLPNRANLTITDISGCHLSANGTINTPSAATPSQAPQTPAKTETSTTPAPAATQSGPTQPQSTSGLQKATESIHNVINKVLGIF